MQPFLARILAIFEGPMRAAVVVVAVVAVLCALSVSSQRGGAKRYPRQLTRHIVACVQQAARLGVMGEQDENPVLIDTGMVASSIKWNTNGSVLAVSGNQASNGAADRRDVSMVQFYSAHGLHLRTLKVPGSGISACSWEGGSLRLALAVDSYIYFANIRPDYKWGAFAGTVACAYTSPERADWSVLFWAEKTDERRVKHVKRLVHVAAAGEHAVMVQAVDAPSSAGRRLLLGAAAFLTLPPPEIALGAAGLSRDDIDKRLSRVPVFCVTNKEAAPYLTEMSAAGKRSGFFFLSPQDAVEALNDIKAFDPRASLNVLPLDQVWYDVAKTVAEADAAPQPTAGTSTDMRLFRLRPLDSELEAATRFPSGPAAIKDEGAIPLFYEPSFKLAIDGREQQP